MIKDVTEDRRREEEHVDRSEELHDFLRKEAVAKLMAKGYSRKDAEEMVDAIL